MHSIPLVICALVALPPEHIAEQITVLKVPFDDLGDALHVPRIHGTIRLREPRTGWAVEVERYKDGKKQPARRLGSSSGGPKAEECEFSIQAIDLDYLRLGDAPKKHCRLVVKIAKRGGTVTQTVDLPKNEGNFFFGNQTSSGIFEPETSSADQVPLAYFFSTNAGSVAFPATPVTPDALVDKLTNGDLAIVYLRLK